MKHAIEDAVRCFRISPPVICIDDEKSRLKRISLSGYRLVFCEVVQNGPHLKSDESILGDEHDLL